MKFKSKQYAEALYELLEFAPEEKTSEVLEKFVETMFENGDFGKMDEILEIFGKEWDRKEGVVGAKIVTAYEISEEAVEVLREYIISRTGASRVDVRNEIDEEILGGAIVEYEDKVLDASLKKDIKELKELIVS